MTVPSSFFAMPITNPTALAGSWGSCFHWCGPGVVTTWHAQYAHTHTHTHAVERSCQTDPRFSSLAPRDVANFSYYGTASGPRPTLCWRICWALNEAPRLYARPNDRQVRQLESGSLRWYGSIAIELTGCVRSTGCSVAPCYDFVAGIRRVTSLAHRLHIWLFDRLAWFGVGLCSSHSPLSFITDLDVGATTLRMKE